MHALPEKSCGAASFRPLHIQPKGDYTVPMKLLRLFLLLILPISSTASAYSQIRMIGSQSITICSPSGAHRILLDANGTPISIMHGCDDCCLTFINDGDDANGISPDIYSAAFKHELHTHQAWIRSLPSHQNARAPPSIV